MTPGATPYGRPTGAVTFTFGHPKRWFLIGLAALLVIGELGIASGEATAGIAAGASIAAACWTWAFVAWRYRLRVEDGVIWVRLGREHGPIHLDRVAAAGYHHLKGSPRLELVQADGGAPWRRSWFTTMIPRRTARQVEPSGSDRLRTVTIGLGLLGHDAVLHELAPHLLAAPGIVLDDETRTVLGRFATHRGTIPPA